MIIFQYLLFKWLPIVIRCMSSFFSRPLSLSHWLRGLTLVTAA